MATTTTTTSRFNFVMPMNKFDYDEYLRTNEYTVVTAELLIIGLDFDPMYNIDEQIDINLVLLRLPGNTNLTLLNETKIAFKTSAIDLNDKIISTLLPTIAFIWQCTDSNRAVKYVLDPTNQHFDIRSLEQLTLPGHIAPSTTVAPTTTEAPTTTTTTVAETTTTTTTI
jgi:hypothetical protein